MHTFSPFVRKEDFKPIPKLWKICVVQKGNWERGDFIFCWIVKAAVEALYSLLLFYPPGYLLIATKNDASVISKS